VPGVRPRADPRALPRHGLAATGAGARHGGEGGYVGSGNSQSRATSGPNQEPRGPNVELIGWSDKGGRMRGILGLVLGWFEGMKGGENEGRG
jgi:hypothetical protein